MKFEVGDRVKINKQATIDDFTKNFWNGCKFDTLSFLQFYGDEDKTFKVIHLNSKSVDLEDTELKCTKECINVNILRKIEVKEMTIAEIEKELGYPIKIIKEDKED